MRLVFVRPGEPLPVADLVILPGSKATIADLAFFREQGWDIDLVAHVRRGGRVLGICGGYQMLGSSVADPEGIEGPPGEVGGSGSSTSRPSDGREDAARGRGRERRRRRAVPAATRCMSARRAARTARGRSCASPTAGRRGGLGERTGRGRLCARAVRRRPPARRLARRARRGSELEYETTVERRSTRLPTTCAHLDLDAMLQRRGNQFSPRRRSSWLATAPLQGAGKSGRRWRLR